MTISEQQAREFARFLPDGLSCDNARQRLLSVVEALRLLTDREHPLSNADLRLVLAARFGFNAVPAENTLNADIRSLRGLRIMGYTFHTGPMGTWCESDAFSPAHVRLLFNAVQSSRFLTADESAEVQEALLDLVSYYQEDQMVGEVHVVQRMEAAGRSAVLDACDAIARAMREDRKVAFEYTFNNFEGAQVALPGDDGSPVRVETPIALYFSEGTYYLESYSATPWRHGRNILRSRVDRMRAVHVSDESGDTCEEVEEARRTAARRMKREFQMFSGIPRTVFLRVSAERTNEMFDLFGFGLEFANFIGVRGDKDSTGDTCVQVAQSPTFFRWLAGMGGTVRMVAPPSSLALQSQPWRHLIGGKTYAQLLEDYEAMCTAYREFLDTARLGC
ncbi:MAG: WYL domain-containing protein [Coriobacteriia bacterium]|nr:WYL domain-containing protein [Coriobacteriia bacterium]